MRALITWLKGLFLHPKEETTEMSEALNTTSTADPVAVQTTVTPTSTATTATTVTSDDSVLNQVKTLLVNIGHDVDAEWEAVVALAKALVAKSN